MKKYWAVFILILLGCSQPNQLSEESKNEMEDLLKHEILLSKRKMEKTFLDNGSKTPEKLILDSLAYFDSLHQFMIRQTINSSSIEFIEDSLRYYSRIALQYTSASNKNALKQLFDSSLYFTFQDSNIVFKKEEIRNFNKDRSNICQDFLYITSSYFTIQHKILMLKSYPKAQSKQILTKYFTSGEVLIVNLGTTNNRIVDSVIVDGRTYPYSPMGTKIKFPPVSIKKDIEKRTCYFSLYTKIVNDSIFKGSQDYWIQRCEN